MGFEDWALELPISLYRGGGGTFLWGSGYRGRGGGSSTWWVSKLRGGCLCLVGVRWRGWLLGVGLFCGLRLSVYLALCVLLGVCGGGPRTIS
ncbi:hypothetical protein ODS41_07595 [Pyrobaculum sp. 3827-6]|uniref:hypothetical protein n=1 Tax=Pyrobaculum sp. 3827-6 TaxID=2983604 RepID=UPI0021DA5578|nr:hypothetical protein [Pyrobaculum sp. 3827-6]MCU7787775.1 hypothetical protein [Pyrobaculum sp. 3827-6]